MISTNWLARPVASVWSGCRSAWRRAAPAVVDLVYAPRCVYCLRDLSPRVDDLLFCADCRDALAPPVPAWCRRCGAPLVGRSVSVEACVRCHRRRFAWQGVVALGRYHGQLSRAVVRAKSFSGEPLAAALGQLLFDRRGDALQQLAADLVVPVPLHWSRRIARGANGPDQIASVLARRLGLPLDTRSLRRRRLTPLQVDVTHVQRRLVQRHSFRVSTGRRVRGRRVLLVDDVLTTGATAQVAAQALLDTGAKAVVVAVIARAIGDTAA